MIRSDKYRNAGWASLLLLALAACTGPSGDTLRLATAASAQYATEELCRAFSAETGQPCELVVSSSGKLTAQIVQGAPYDILLAANLMYPRRLVAEGMAADSPRVYALGALVLWSAGAEQPLPDLGGLPGAVAGKIALANPRNAPYGAEAVRALRHYGVFEAVAGQLVYGESIAQANQYILSGACALGFTAKSVVMSPRFRQTGAWAEVPAEAYRPIRQGVVLTRYGAERHPEASRRFLDFLASPAGQQILLRHGYRLPAEASGGF